MVKKINLSKVSEKEILKDLSSKFDPSKITRETSSEVYRYYKDRSLELIFKEGFKVFYSDGMNVVILKHKEDNQLYQAKNCAVKYPQFYDMHFFAEPEVLKTKYFGDLLMKISRDLEEIRNSIKGPHKDEKELDKFESRFIPGID